MTTDEPTGPGEPLGRVATYTYDGNGRLVSARDGPGAVTRTTRAAAARVVGCGPAGRVTDTFESSEPSGPRPVARWYTVFDALGRVIHSGPEPMPAPPPAGDDAPDEPYVVG